MKTHLAWFCVSVAAFLAGMQFGKKENRMVDKPAAVVMPKEGYFEPPIPPSLPSGQERSAALSRRDATSTSDPAAAPRKRTSDEEKAFWENGENHLLLDLYGPLMSRLRLEPGEAADLVDLLREVRRSLLDVMEARRAEKLSDPEALAQITEDVATSMDSRIRELLGQDRFSAFNTYRERLPETITVRKLSALLAPTETPLTDTQARRLVQLYFDMQTAHHRRYAPATALIQVNGIRPTKEMIRASAGVLSPNQMAYFEKLEAEQNVGYFQKLRKEQDEGK